MKTAISIPNPIFEAAEQLAQQMGMSRSELYTTALVAYLETYQSEQVTEKLNQVYAEEASAIDPMVLQMQVMTLDGDEW